MKTVTVCAWSYFCSFPIRGLVRKNLFLSVFCAVSMSIAAANELVDEIDPMIGAITLSGYGGHGLGKTFPGACTPFGMVQLSPDTITGGDNGPGYSYHHTTIEGFSMTHMSGIGWYGDLGNFQVMPANGPRILEREKAASPFSHTNEIARAGFYSVRLDRYGIGVELLAYPDQHGRYIFTYPANPVSRIQIDLARRIGETHRRKQHSTQTLMVDEENRAIAGEIRCDHRDGGWGRGSGLVDYTLYYYARFSKPIVSFGREGAPSDTVFWTEFPTTEGERVTLDVWISYESVERAKQLASQWREDKIAPAPWRWAFERVKVKGGTTKQRRIFATALYHAFIDPRKIDMPGQSRTVFSGWDVFRSEMPLLTLLYPEVVADTINAMAGVMESGKRDTLPVWDLFGCKSGCMIGNPLIPVIATAQEAGVPGVDYARMLDLAVATSEKRGNASCGFTPGSLSCTLEYCFDDWCVGKIAEQIGRRDVAERFFARAGWYTNCWDATVESMRSRAKKGDGWLEPWKGETVHGQGTVESNPLQQGWFVPHDPQGLIALMGGRPRFLSRLETFFQKAPEDFLWGNYYNHPNEPSHHIVFLFAEAGRPDLTQYWTRRILDRAYGDGVKGLCGNDDVGQMSAWYVLAALGFNPMCPGSGRWTITTPIFPEATLKVHGHELRILAKGAEDVRNEIVRSVRVDGQKIERYWLTTKELLTAKTIEMELTERGESGGDAAFK
ncbi:MAG: GH92 family glycosyl hydrolase [Kiritimatiellae bacterium]|nr:GH92 family glycosyl hydrolase [Kiritimatiellia bacterium]